MRKQQREVILDDSDLMDFVEKASAEDRARGIIEPSLINFKKEIGGSMEGEKAAQCRTGLVVSDSPKPITETD